MTADKTYSLQEARKATNWAFVSTGEKSGAITRLIDLATDNSGTNYRIIDEQGVVVWQRINHQGGPVR